MEARQKPFDRVIIAKRLKDLYEEITPLIEGFTEKVCPSCENVCCKHQHGHLEYEDEVFISALGEEIPLARKNKDGNDWCDFLSSTGCIKPRWQRPFRCTWYFCEPLLEVMPEVNPRAMRKIQKLLREIQTLRIALTADL